MESRFRVVGVLLAVALIAPTLAGPAVAAAADAAHAGPALAPTQGEVRVCGCTPGTGEFSAGRQASAVGTLPRAGDVPRASTTLDNTTDTADTTTTAVATTETTTAIDTTVVDSTTTATVVATNTTDTVGNTTDTTNTTDTVGNTTDTVNDTIDTTVVDGATDTVDSTTVETTLGGSVVGPGATSSSADATTTDQQSQRATTETTADGNASASDRNASASDGRGGTNGVPADTPLSSAVANGAALLSAGAFAASSTFRRATTLSFAYPTGMRRVFFPGGVLRVPGLGTARRTVMTTRTRFGGDPRDWLWRLAGLFGYSRYDDSDPLDNERRRAIHDCVQAYPGIYPSAIGERTDTPLSTVRYHLDVLHEESLLDRESISGKRRYFPPGEDAKRLVAALRDESRRAILEALAERGAATGAELAVDLERNKSTIAHHLGRLEDEGLIEREREGRTVLNRPTPEVREVLGSQKGLVGADD